MKAPFGKLALCTLGFFVLTVPPSEAAVIFGKVQNGTANLEPVQNCSVQLVSFSTATFQRQVVDSVLTNSRGGFRFGTVKADSGLVYVVAADYMGVSYLSDILQVLRSDTTVELAITAYDTTSQAPEVSVQMHHVFAERDTADVLFREVLVVHNSSNRTYIGKEDSSHIRRTLAFSVPPMAYAFQTESGLDLHRAMQVAHTLYDMTPLLPGIRQVSYSYRLAPEKGALNYSRKLDYPTRVFSFFVSDPNLEIESPGLSREENFVIRGRSYQRLAAQNLSAGALVEVSLRGSDLGGGSSIQRFWWLLALIVAVSAFVFVLLTRRSRPAGAVQADPLVAQREELMHQIAALDDAYEEGKIEETAYRQQRKQLKSQLVRLTSELQSRSSTS